MKEEQGAGPDESQSILPGVGSSSLWLAVCDAPYSLVGAASEGREGWSVMTSFWLDMMGSFRALLCLPLPALHSPGRGMRPGRDDLGEQFLCSVYRNCGDRTAALVNHRDLAGGKFPSHVGSPVSF